MRGIAVVTMAAVAVAGLLGQLASRAHAASADQFHYIGPNGLDVCANVTFPQANWFHSTRGMLNTFSVGWAQNLAATNHRFLVGYVKTGQVDVAGTAPGYAYSNMYIGGPALNPNDNSTTAGNEGTYYRVDSYMLYAGACPPSTLKASASLHWCSNQVKTICKQAVVVLPGRTKMKIVCAENGSSASASASTRWLFIRAANHEGYVPAASVRGQTMTSNCSSMTAMKATDWALTKLGSRQWDGNCLGFINEAYGGNLPPPKGGQVSAASWWRAQRMSQRHTTGSPPRGALVFWGVRPGYPDGHAALSLGNGWAISTYERSVHGVHVFALNTRNPKTYNYVGWWNFGR